MTSAATDKDGQSPFAILTDYASRAVARDRGTRAAAAGGDAWDGMLCRLGAERVVVPLADVTEVIDIPRLTEVPGTASWFLGLGNLRGRAIPFNDLGGYLHGRGASRSSIRRALVIELDTDAVAFVVDDLLGMHTLNGARRAYVSYQGDNLPVMNLAELAKQARFQRVDLESV